MSDQEQLDREQLIALPAFLRFLSRSIQSAGIYSGTTNGADGRNLVSEGRRNLGLDILHDAAGAIPLPDPEARLKMLLLSILREDAQSTPPPEKPRGRRSRDDSDDNDGSDART
jgi:hypothetical protein